MFKLTSLDTAVFPAGNLAWVRLLYLEILLLYLKRCCEKDNAYVHKTVRPESVRHLDD